jgi:hypothetical protein
MNHKLMTVPAPIKQLKGLQQELPITRACAGAIYVGALLLQDPSQHI